MSATPSWRQGGLVERPAASSNHEGSPVTTSPVRVLFVEDEPLVLNIFSRALRRRGFDIVAASTGPEAVELGRTADPPIDIAVIDFVLPGLSGPEVYETLSQRQPDLPVVFATGEYERVLEYVSQQAPHAAVLIKPFTVERLVTVLEQTLGPKTDDA